MNNGIVASVLAKEFVAAGQGTLARDSVYSNLTVTHEPVGYIEWTVTLPAAGLYRLQAQMTAAEARPCTLSVNGAAVGTILGEVTGSWQADGLEWFEYGPYAFNAGPNRFRIDFSAYQPHVQAFAFLPVALALTPLAQQVAALEAAYQAALAEPLNYLCRLEVAVGTEWKGVHVQNQSQANGTLLVRQHGAGNVMRFVPSTEFDGGFHLLIDVRGTWKSAQIKGQAASDYAALIRSGGKGNVFKIEQRDDGLCHLRVQAGKDYTEWKGVHVYHQSDDDNVRLLRHSGRGNPFQIVATDTLAEPARIEALKSQWLARQAEYAALQAFAEPTVAAVNDYAPQPLPLAIKIEEEAAASSTSAAPEADAAPAATAATVTDNEQAAASTAEAAPDSAEVPAAEAPSETATAAEAEPAATATETPSAAEAMAQVTATDNTTAQQALNLVKLCEETVLPGSSLLMQGNIVEGGAHTALWFGLRMAGGLVGGVGWIVLAANSYSKSVSGKHLHQHVAALLDKQR